MLSCPSSAVRVEIPRIRLSRDVHPAVVSIGPRPVRRSGKRQELKRYVLATRQPLREHGAIVVKLANSRSDRSVARWRPQQ
jgi:hypothetical protein